MTVRLLPFFSFYCLYLHRECIYVLCDFWIIYISMHWPAHIFLFIVCICQTSLIAFKLNAIALVNTACNRCACIRFFFFAFFRTIILSSGSISHFDCPKAFWFGAIIAAFDRENHLVQLCDALDAHFNHSLSHFFLPRFFVERDGYIEEMERYRI